MSPRKIVAAFDLLAQGTSPENAVSTMAMVATPEYHDIAFAVCFGKWSTETSMFGGTVTIQPLGKLLKDLDDRLKKKPSVDDNTEEAENTVDEDDIVDSKPEAARVLRAIVGAFLKGRVLPKIQKKGIYKYPALQDCERAVAAMRELGNMVPADNFELQWSGLFITLFRINQIMQGK